MFDITTFFDKKCYIEFQLVDFTYKDNKIIAEVNINYHEDISDLKKQSNTKSHFFIVDDHSICFGSGTFIFTNKEKDSLSSCYELKISNLSKLETYLNLDKNIESGKKMDVYSDGCHIKNNSDPLLYIKI